MANRHKTQEENPVHSADRRASIPAGHRFNAHREHRIGFRRPAAYFPLAGAVGLALFWLTASPSPAQETATTAAQGARLYRELGCYGCHTMGKTGTPIAPDLSKIGAKHDRAYLEQWLRDPSAQRPTAHMPKITMSEPEAKALAAYLSSLR
jgi:mono/diheme cytochrome c family protein